MSERPLTITAEAFVAGDYGAKIARGECVVTDFGYSICSITPTDNSIRFKVKQTDNYSFITRYDSTFAVEWLPQPEREEAAAREFADGWRDAEIARLQGDKSKLREALRNIAATARSERGAIRRLHTIETLATEALSMFVDSEPDHK